MSLRTTLLLTAALLLPTTAQAQPEGKPACGIDYLPLMKGAQWTYEPTESPLPLTEEQTSQLTKWKMVHPPPPKKVVIKVLDVADADGATVVTLEEKADEIVHKTTIRCTRGGMEVDPQSFFFAAEPGGAILMELSDIQRSGDSYPGAKGFKRKSTAQLSIKAKLTRKASEGSGASITDGTVEIERTLYESGTESVATPTGKHSKSQKVEFDLAGRVSVAPSMDKSTEIPIRWRGVLWFKDGVGLVQARNRIGHWFQLVEHNLK